MSTEECDDQYGRHEYQAAILRAMADCAFVVGSDRDVEHANQAALSMADISAEVIEDESIVALTEQLVADSEDLERFERALESVFAEDPDTEYPVTVELELTTSDGDITAEYRCSPHSVGENTKAVVIVTDITERKERERELREREQRLQALFDRAPDPIFVQDAEGKFTQVNETAVEKLGYSREELLEMEAADIDAAVDRTDARELLSEVKDDGQTTEIEGQHQCADGSTYPVDVRVSPLETDGEDRFLSHAREISERKEREQRLEELQERLDLAVESANLGVWDWNVETDAVTFNDQWAEMLGLSPEDIEPHLDTWEERVHPDDMERVEEALEAHLSGEAERYDCEHRMLTASGDWKWIRDVGEVVQRDADGNPTRAVGVHIDISERKQHEAELEHQQEFLAQTQEVANIGGWEFDRRTETLQWTDEVYRIHGLPTDADLTVEDGIEFYHPDDRETMREAFERLTTDGEQYDMELRIVKPDGEVRWVRTRGEPLYEDGEVITVRGTFQDITERKDRERELKQKQEFLTQTQEVANVGGWEVDGQEQTVQWTAEMYRIFGVDPDFDPSLSSIIEFVHPDDRESLSAAYERLRTDGEPYDIEVRIVRDEEDVRWVRARGDPITEDGKTVGSRGTAQDITERKEREQELDQKREFLEQTQRVAGVGGWEVDFRAERQQWTDEVYRIHGLPPDANPSVEDGIEFYHPDDRSEIEAAFERLTTEGEPYDLELRLIRADGEVRWVRTQGEPLYLNGEIVGGRGTIQDITERKARRQELEKKNERLNEFASVISHDLQNPLTVAIGRTTVLEQMSDGEALEQVQTIADSLDRMERIIEDTLTLARKGDTVAERHPVSSIELVGNCWGQVETGDAVVEVDEEFTILGDENRLKHVFENLFANAVTHGSGDAVVRVGRDGENSFYVEDDGTGIPAEDRETVFEAGYSSERDGTGFGLAIVKRIAEAHGWDVSVTEASDGGARFEFDGVEIRERE